MIGDLSGARLKFGRAYQHFHTLHREIEVFSKTHPCAVRHDFDAQLMRHEWRVAGVPRQPWPEMSATLGDMLNNFRSSLEYIAHELGGRSFPIVANAADWPRQSRQLDGVEDRARARIEAFQPCFRRDYIGEFLGWLARLNNWDKHNRINLVTAFSHGGGFATPIGLRGFEIYSGTVEDGTVLAWVVCEETNVNFIPAIGVALYPGMWPDRPSLVYVINGIHKAVREVLSLLASEFFPGQVL